MEKEGGKYIDEMVLGVLDGYYVQKRLWHCLLRRSVFWTDSNL